jgi:CRP/FNR family transcriptional regulator, cyclic AMP receptor protein
MAASNGDERFARAEAVRFFEIEPDLLCRLGATDADALRRQAVVPVVRIPRGKWRSPPSDSPSPGLYFILDGFVALTVLSAGKRGAEIFGSGDIIDPAPEEATYAPLAFESTWVALAPTRVAVLDGEFLRCLARCPAVSQQVLSNMTRRCEKIALDRSIAQVRGLANRIMLRLWEVAGRWGTVTAEGTVLPLRLSHETLGELLGASRPSVTDAIHELMRDGKLERGTDGRWILLRKQPARLRSPTLP